MKLSEIKVRILPETPFSKFMKITDETETQILAVKKLVQKLEKIQQNEFDSLSKELGLTESEDNFLFDFVFNSGDDSFRGYLAKLGQSF